MASSDSTGAERERTEAIAHAAPVAAEDGGEPIPGVPTEPEVIDVDAIEPSEEVAPAAAADAPPGPGWVPVSTPRATAVSSAGDSALRRYPDGLAFDNLKRLEADLFLTRQALDHLHWLEAEYESSWSGDWWSSRDRRTLEWSHQEQVHQFRQAVRHGDVTTRQRYRL